MMRRPHHPVGPTADGARIVVAAIGLSILIVSAVLAALSVRGVL